MPIDFQLNGQPVQAEGDPQTTLLDFLRAKGLTGAKEGCAEGECGACTVVMVRQRGDNPAYVPVNSCLMLLAMAAGQEIYSVEALAAGGSLHPVQQAMVECGGSQCGYCTPGFVMSLFADHYRPGMHSVHGNLCRCTGYRPIADAAARTSSASHDAWNERLKHPAPPIGDAACDGFARPTSLAGAFDAFRDHPGAQWIAGGTDLVVEANLHLKRFSFLISLEAVRELRAIRETSDLIEIGAGVPLSEIDALPADFLDLFASPLIRNRATLGGNLATASPIGDSAPLLLVMDAQLRLASAQGERVLPLSEFFLGYRKTALQPGALIVSVILPKPLPPTLRFYKAAKRRMDDISTVAAAFAIDAAGRLRMAYGGVAPVPLRALEAEAAVNPRETLARILKPISDHRGSAGYRLALAQNLLDKFLHSTHPSSHSVPTRGAGFQPAMPRFGGAFLGGIGRLEECSEESGHGRPEACATPHESARGHVIGDALYTDDLLSRFPNLLHAWPVMSPYAHARLDSLDLSPALEEPGVVSTLHSVDVPGEGDSGANRHDEPLFPTEVLYHRQPVAWILAESLEAAQRGAARVIARYWELPPILTIEDAIAQNSFHSGPHHLARGDVREALSCIPHRLSGELHIGGQEHFYLETQCAIAWLDEAGGVSLHSSTQHPSETQEVVARVLGVPRNQITVECLRMGGAFGGKEVQANPWAAIAALGAWKTRRPVRLRLPRVLDMALTGKRHPFLARFDTGFDDEGRIQAFTAALYSDAGWSLDLSDPIVWRALFHLDNAYYIPNLEATATVCFTHKTSQTAFRGFGGPQAMLVIEDVLDRIARTLGLPPEIVRERNFYREGHTTHYGQQVKAAGRIATIWNQLTESSSFHQRRAQIAAFNVVHPHTKRGIAITPVKFGISFTATFYNQGGALVLIYRDGSVQVNHGGTEMGQGLHTKIREIAAHSLGVPLATIRVMPTRTDKVPNTSATAASASTDLNGAAVADACEQLKSRLAPVAGRMLGGPAESVCFENGEAFVPGAQIQHIPFAHVVEAAYRQRIALFAQGYYRTPGILFDPRVGQGKPFHYYAYGAAVTEVEVDGFTGEHRVLRVDILQDVGDSVAPLVDRGQVEGGFIQGLGWLTLEELLWDQQGRVATAGASTYKLPSWSELPDTFHVAFLERATESDVIRGSKAVGEPPLMLAISVREALRDAIAAFGSGGLVTLDSPATPERIYWAIARSRTPQPHSPAAQEAHEHR
jgi:xanthine dehydrogenase molybdopterin binding subunit/xanthine dehydrogenase small subunit